MHRTLRLAAVAVLLGLLVVPAMAARYWILDTEYNEFRVVVSPRAAISDFQAAAAFQESWEHHTGFRPEVGPEPVLGMVNVWIGEIDNPFAAEMRAEALGAGGFHIRTFDRSWRKRIRDHYGIRKSMHVQERYDLSIVGGGEAGALAGVDEFFSQFMREGVGEDAAYIPAPPDRLPKIDLCVEQPLPNADAGVTLDGSADGAELGEAQDAAESSDEVVLEEAASANAQ